MIISVLSLNEQDNFPRHPQNELFHFFSIVISTLARSIIIVKYLLEMEAPQTSRRRATSVVTSQFLRHDPLPWNIKVNFDAATVTPKPTVVSEK